MSTKAKIAIFSAIVAVCSLAWSIPSWAGDRNRHHDTRTYTYEDGRRVYHDRRSYYRHYHHNNHRRRSDNDDWAWALGGLILGAAIANNAEQPQTQTQSRLPPPQRRVQTCYDEVAYNSNNEPYVLRRCFETVE